MERLIRQEQAISAFVEGLRNSVYHCWPGSVATYDTTDQIASVTVMVNDPRRDPETGQSYGEPWPVLPGVPVAWMRAGGYTVSGILNPGDPVILIAFDVDPSAWIAQGPSQQPVNPNDVRRHGGGYWWALPVNFFGPITDAAGAAAGLLIGKDGDTAQVRFSPGQVIVGNAGATVELSGGGAAVGRVGDQVQVTFTVADGLNLIAPGGSGGPCTVPGGAFTLTGTITAGSPKVTSG